MCYKEVITTTTTTNDCCEGTACKEPGDQDYAELKCCIEYYEDDPGCDDTIDCCDDNANCVKPAGSDTGICCIGNGVSCTEDDGGCCVGLLCTGGKCEDCLGLDQSCPSGGLGCCDGLVCTGGKCEDCLGLDQSCPSGGLGCCDGLVCKTDYSTYPYSACVPLSGCIGEDKPCMGMSSSCCGGLNCVPRSTPLYGSRNLCSDCLPATDPCEKDEDCCDSLRCIEITSTWRWCSNFLN
jgi:hypothetical protein